MGKKPSPSISLRWPSFKKPLWGDIISCKNNYTTVFEKHPTKFFCAKKIYNFGPFWNKNSHKVLCNFSAKIKTFKISAKKPFLVQKLKLLILRIFTFFSFWRCVLQWKKGNPFRQIRVLPKGWHLCAWGEPKQQLIREKFRSDVPSCAKGGLAEELNTRRW